MIRSLLLLAMALPLAAQDPAPAPTFPALPLPIAIAAFGEFNQLGNPRIQGGISAVYPIAGSLGVYGTTTSDIAPKPAVDPATGRNFYAFNSSIRQGLHKDILDTGKMSVLVGGDIGPSFASTASGVNVNFSSSLIVTAVYQVRPSWSLIMPVRMLYVSGIGWNPVIEIGIMINLSKLPKAKP